MTKIKSIWVGFCKSFVQDTVNVGKDFDEKTGRVARGFSNFG